MPHAIDGTVEREVNVKGSRQVPRAPGIGDRHALNATSNLGVRVGSCGEIMVLRAVE